MEEHSKNAKGRYKADDEKPHRKETTRNRAPVGELILHRLQRYQPTYKDTGKERATHQQDIRREVIAEIKEALAKDGKINSTARQ